MPEMKIGDRLVGDGHPAYIIAEIGVNHNGILDYALQLIDAAVRAGADAVKFQKRDIESMLTPDPCGVLHGLPTEHASLPRVRMDTRVSGILSLENS